jgi:3-oxoadipate enol-lactonase
MTFAISGDSRLYFEDRGQRNANTVVLIPGLGLTGSAWAAVADRLADAYRILTIDPRGAGRSDKPDTEYTVADVAEDLRAILDTANVTDAHVVGLSMGGMIAQDLAIRFPDRVRTLTLLSTYAAPDDWSRRLFEVRKMIIERIGLAEQFRLSILTVSSPLTFRSNPEVIASVEHALVDNLPDERAYLRQLEYCMNHDARDELRKIRIPTLVLTGSEDLLTSPFQGRELAAAIVGAEYREVQGRSHVLVFEDPDEVVAEVRRFISRVDGT